MLFPVIGIIEFSTVDNLESVKQGMKKRFHPIEQRLLAKGNETVTNYNALKIEAPDGKMRLTDVVTCTKISYY